jgi:adenylate kinase
MAFFVVLLGPPGAGKGTQAQMVSRVMNLPHISSGVLFREHLEGSTELGELARGFIEKGELVPDDVTIAMIRDRISQPDCSDGALLDGFPRTPAQAEALDQILIELYGSQVSAVPYIGMPEEVLIDRLTGRWTCRAKEHVFHEKYNPPREKGICDYDGSELYQRDDDKEETIRKRVRVYLEKTAPLIEMYENSGKLIRINGRLAIDEVSEEILAALEKVQ